MAGLQRLVAGQIGPRRASRCFVSTFLNGFRFFSVKLAAAADKTLPGGTNTKPSSVYSSTSLISLCLLPSSAIRHAHSGSCQGEALLFFPSLCATQGGSNALVQFHFGVKPGSYTPILILPNKLNHTDRGTRGVCGWWCGGGRGVLDDLRSKGNETGRRGGRWWVV